MRDGCRVEQRAAPSAVKPDTAFVTAMSGECKGATPQTACWPADQTKGAEEGALLTSPPEAPIHTNWSRPLQ